MTVIENIAFIGAGNMGRPMIRHLVAAGYPVAVSVRRAEARDAVRALGARALRSPAEAAAKASFVLTNVTSTPDVEAVLFGPEGVMSSAALGTVCVDLSTISPLSAVEFARRLNEAGLEMLDAPVSGGVKGAEAATLSIMVGGKTEVLDRARPLLRCLGTTITHIGDHGAGQVAKACNQIVQVVNIQGIAEAMLFARKLGTDPAKILTAIGAGMAGSKMLDLMGPKMVSHDFSVEIEARLHAKDFGLIDEASRKLSLSMPATQLVHGQLGDLVERGWGADDTSSLLRVLEMQGRPMRH